MRLYNKTAIITGGAKGIGFATVRKFLEEGASVILVDINKQNIDLALNELNNYKKRQLKSFVVDVTNKADIEDLLDFATDNFNHIDILINNAGITADAQLFKMEENQWDAVINVNLKAIFMLTQKIASHMKNNNTGVILNASSIVGIYGNFGQTNYAASKFGINGMTKTWAKELGKYNVRVNSVAPGFILTEMTDKIPENILKSMKDKSVLNRLGNPEDVANAYAFLASEEASYITGSVINVDGGVVV